MLKPLVLRRPSRATNTTTITSTTTTTTRTSTRTGTVSWVTSPASDTLARPEPASNWLDAFCAGDPDGGTLIRGTARRRRAGDDIQALVDFLLHHPPPPDSYTSMPYGAREDHAGGPWSKIKKMGRRSKSLPRASPRQIQLPDSAVSGTTIGGHRHIAISIPLEASPFADAARSQYPVYPQQDLSMGTPSKEAVRTYTNDKGVVTVLGPVTEVAEPSSPPRFSPRLTFAAQRTQSLRARAPPPPPPPPPPPSDRLDATDPATARKPHDYIGVLPTRFDSPLLDDNPAPWNRGPPNEDSLTRFGHCRPPTLPFQRLACIARGCGAVCCHGAQHHSASIDGLITAHDRTRSTAYGPRQGNFLGSSSPAKPAADGVAMAKAEPTSATLRPQAPGAQDRENQGRATTCKVPAPCRREDSTSPPLTPSGAARGRKDVVRDRKRRDMEAMRNASRRDQASRQEAYGEASLRQRHGGAGSRSQAARDKADTAAQPLTMSGVMVVVDVEPCSSSDESHSPRAFKTRPGGSAGKAHWGPGEIDDASTPTLAASPSPSPTRKLHEAADGASPMRRREAKATRDEERNARSALLVARGKAKRLAPSGSYPYSESQVSQTDKGLAGLYEAHREHRLQDVERRLRQLERNCDVWLRVLAPVMDETSRRRRGAANDEPLGVDGRDWPSDYDVDQGDGGGDDDDDDDDDDGPLADGRGWAREVQAVRGAREEARGGGDGVSAVVQAGKQDTERRPASRRSSLSRGRLLEEAVRERDDDEAWRGSSSSGNDMSGLGTIEPLMRELAGEARGRHGKARAAGIGGGQEACHAI